MILDTLNNYKRYLSLNKNFTVAFKFIESYIVNPLPVGKYEIIGDEVFALVQEYATKTEARAESHSKYIDIQFIVSGNEKMECIDIAKCRVEEDCRPEKDMIYYFDNSKRNSFVVNQNEYAIFFPNDVHKPALFNEAEFVKKIVVKVCI